MLFIAEHGLTVEEQIVDLMTGEQYGPGFTAINPNNFVPVLEHGDFRLTESSAILKYLAELTGSPSFPIALRERARVNAAMDWVNTGLYRTFGYGLCYAQILDNYRLTNPDGQAEALAAAKAGAGKFLTVMNDHMLADQPYLCGGSISLADYLASGILSLGETIGCTFTDWPNMRRWYDAMRARPRWAATNGGLDAWAEALRGPDYVRL